MRAGSEIRRKAAVGPKPQAPETALRALLDEVVDPEIPDLTIAELGILRNVEIANPDGAVIVTITPTYTGCPAMAAIEMQIRDVLLRAEYPAVEVRTVLAPAWTTDWLTPEARRKLRALGIAPPVAGAGGSATAPDDITVACPRCDSRQTRCLSRFGSTSCKALFHCDSCLEPFEYFKCL